MDISLAAVDDSGARLEPRIWMAGGGYVGKQGNSIVKFVDGYYDMWWSRDGLVWTQVGSYEGAGEYHCSTLEMFKVSDGTDAYYLGKYGHTALPLFRFTEGSEGARVCREYRVDGRGFIQDCKTTTT